MNKLALPDDTGAAAVALAKAKQVHEFVQVHAPQSAQQAMDEADQIKQMQKVAETERDQFAKPIRAVLTQHTSRWNPTIKLLDAARKLRVSQAQQILAAEREEQTRALSSATSAAEVAQAVAVLSPPVAGLVERTDWGYEIVDRSQIPAEYFLLDEVRLAREARALKESFNVPGCRVVKLSKGVQR